MKSKKEQEFEKKYGVVCPKCGLRKTSIGFASGHNLPKGGGGCRCLADED